MSARRAAAESARLARLRERVRYLQQDLVNGTLYHKKLYVPDRTEKDGIDGCMEEMLTRLDSHLPNKPFHQMRHIKPSVRRFKEREGLGFRNWLSWVRECQSIIAPDIFAPMNPPPCSYAENEEEGESPEIEQDEDEEPDLDEASFLETETIPEARVSVRLPPEEDDLAPRAPKEGAAAEEEDEEEYGIHLEVDDDGTGDVMSDLDQIAPLEEEDDDDFPEMSGQPETDSRNAPRLHPYLMVPHEDLAALIEEKGI